ncbi:MAG TPA: hypothetical protein VFV85_09715, partial [Conexibacter sp.]|nr:hypothetical protein [Conexibacter sp.]
MPQTLDVFPTVGQQPTAFHTRVPATPPFSTLLTVASPGAELFVRTLGHTRVLRNGAEIRGSWLEQLPGQLLKLLVTFRDEMVPVEQIAEALWPGGGASSLASVRFTVH